MSKFFRRRKFCKFTAEGVKEIDYKDLNTLRQYLTELTRTELAEILRGALFPTTPDVLHAYLQSGGRPAFRVRLLLAATLSPLARGTVELTLLHTGKVDGQDATLFPFPVDQALMARGQERFNIYCSPCHGQTGTGDGMVVRRGYRHPPSFADDRLRQAPVGHFFDVMTNGWGAMPSYAQQVSVEDRWRIVAYLRALQLSQMKAGSSPTVKEGAGSK